MAFCCMRSLHSSVEPIVKFPTATRISKTQQYSLQLIQVHTQLKTKYNDEINDQLSSQLSF